MLRVDEQWVDRTRVGAGGGQPSDVSRSCYEFALVFQIFTTLRRKQEGGVAALTGIKTLTDCGGSGWKRRWILSMPARQQYRA